MKGDVKIPEKVLERINNTAKCFAQNCGGTEDNSVAMRIGFSVGAAWMYKKMKRRQMMPQYGGIKKVKFGFCLN